MSISYRTCIQWLAACLLLEGTVHAQADTAAPRPSTDAYAPVNGVRMHYQIYGDGTPLLVLHGGGGTIANFERQFPYFAKDHRIIAIEQMGHGRTPDGQRPLDYVDMTETTAALLRLLRVEHADVLGWSDGGIVALMLAARHPELVRRLVVTGASILPIPESVRPEVVAELRAYQPDNDTATSAHYRRTSADSAGHFRIFVSRLLDLWFNHPTETEFGHAGLAAIQAPTLVMAGDHDDILLDHTIDIYRSLPNAQLLIVPGTGHATVRDRADWVNPIIRSFLDGDVSTR